MKHFHGYFVSKGSRPRDSVVFSLTPLIERMGPQMFEKGPNPQIRGPAGQSLTPAPPAHQSRNVKLNHKHANMPSVNQIKISTSGDGWQEHLNLDKSWKS